MSFDAPVPLGKGLLTWPPAERELGRFGTVSLRKPETHLYRQFDADLVGQTVRLAFTVTAVRVAALQPDPRLGVAPQPPRAGEEVDLGIGVMFVLDLPRRGPVAVGVLPTEQRLRPVDWLDPAALYKAQNQYGQLTAHPFRGQRGPAPSRTSVPA
ncbi:hypothetical protein L0U85_03840 [Glycomyces sp. L485]|uniref:hypothetical protein n=1 Tax=Glycomyces sp. L485 TaxID=2909235 RepID=UPI001F4A4BBE|nr:hypothetical protein [Glycomyces sp. L485]MCH7229994.1 hypothetical protein [Glycomyces sp. L485]